MERRRIGSLSVSVLGLGAGSFGHTVDRVRSSAVVEAALDVGVNFFDMSDRPPSTEEWVGRAIAHRRDEVVLATKFGSRVQPGVLACASPEYIRVAVDRSLKRLGTDRIDLYQLHRPDPQTPIAETLGALGDLVKAGKVREIGCSKFSPEQLREAAGVAAGAARFVSVQNRLNLLDPLDATTVLPLCEQLGLAYIPFFPLAGGLLTGKYALGNIPAGSRFAIWDKWKARIPEWHTPRNHEMVERLGAWAESRGHSLLELAFAWLIAQVPVATVIAGATTPAQVQTNAAAATSWRLTQPEAVEVTRIATETITATIPSDGPAQTAEEATRGVGSSPVESPR